MNRVPNKPSPSAHHRERSVLQMGSERLPEHFTDARHADADVALDAFVAAIERLGLDYHVTVMGMTPEAPPEAGVCRHVDRGRLSRSTFAQAACTILQNLARIEARANGAWSAIDLIEHLANIAIDTAVTEDPQETPE